jgi:hypothetical protein
MGCGHANLDRVVGHSQYADGVLVLGIWTHVSHPQHRLAGHVRAGGKSVRFNWLRIYRCFLTN